MLAGDIQKTYIFPRIPLNFKLPEDYPDAGVISNFSVTPEITNFKYNRDEIELEGKYTVVVSFYKTEPEPVSSTDVLPESEADDFFSRLELKENGLLSEYSGKAASKIKRNSLELYTVHFSREFHTFVDLEFITRPRVFRPGMVVEKAGFESVDGRNLKGEIVLGLINRPRRGFR